MVPILIGVSQDAMKDENQWAIAILSRLVGEDLNLGLRRSDDDFDLSRTGGNSHLPRRREAEHE
jgi:hypothetical protein